MSRKFQRLQNYSWTKLDLHLHFCQLSRFWRDSPDFGLRVPLAVTRWDCHAFTQLVNGKMYLQLPLINTQFFNFLFILNCQKWQNNQPLQRCLPKLYLIKSLNTIFYTETIFDAKLIENLLFNNIFLLIMLFTQNIEQNYLSVIHIEY